MPVTKELSGAVDTTERKDGIQGPGQAGEVGLWEPNGVQQGQVKGVALGLGQSQVFI